MTWLLWAVLGLVIAMFLVKSGLGKSFFHNPGTILAAIVAIVILYLLWKILGIMLGIADTVSDAAQSPWIPWNW